MITYDSLIQDLMTVNHIYYSYFIIIIVQI